jgi:hypothetical protein
MLTACLIAASLAVPKVELLQVDGKWDLRVDGKSYFIHGAGGDHSLAELKKAGGNSTRTWGAEEIPAKLAEAEKLGITVTAGIWLGHKRHGFDYGDPKQVADQFSKAEAVVQAYRGHPSLLFWALGNEMEVDNDTPELWKAVGELARMVKRIDPHRPVMTVVAEVSPQKIRHIQTLAPEIDVLGINSYGGLGTLPARLKAAGWTKPYVVTEFGPLGPWESGRTDWGAAFEATSTEKAKFYAENYDASIKGQPGWCLGSYAFLWGHKQETTPTWFGMFLPSGESVASLDEISQRWTGRTPQNRSPIVKSITFSAAGKRVEAGAASLRVLAEDPDGDQLTYRVEVRREIDRERPTGEGERGPELMPGYPVSASEPPTQIIVPAARGAYRVYVTVLDGKGKAATANAPFYSLGIEPTAHTSKK